jgi:hypothetical protein
MLGLEKNPAAAVPLVTPTAMAGLVLKEESLFGGKKS